MIDLDPKALAYMRAKAAWDNEAQDASADAVRSTGAAWREAKCPIELPALDRAGFVRVRIVVFMDEEGEWVVSMPSDMSRLRRLFPRDRLTFIEAWVPKPAGPETVEGEVAGE